MSGTRSDVRSDVRADARADEGVGGTLYGLWYDGTDDRVIANASPKFVKDKYFDISFLFNSADPGGIEFYYCHGNSASANQVFSVTSGNAGSAKGRLFVRNNAGSPTLDTETVADVFDGSPHVFRATFDGVSVVKLYVDGVLDKTVTSVSFSGNYTFDKVSIGALERTTVAGYITGLIRQVSVNFGGVLGAYTGSGNTDSDWLDTSVSRQAGTPAVQTLPDGQASDTDKGFTCTGLCISGGYLWASNFGDNIEPSAAPYAPSICQLSLDGATLEAEIDLTTALTNTAQLQGIDRESDGTFWVADLFNGEVYHLSAAGVELSSFTHAGCNGLAIDSTDGSIWILTATTIDNVSTTGTAISSTGHSLVGPDHLCDYGGVVWVSYGGNGSTGNVAIFEKADLRWGAEQALDSDNQAIEGIAVDGDTLYVMNDGYFHGSTSDTKLNRLFTYPFSSQANRNHPTVSGSPSQAISEDGGATWAEES